MGALARHWIPAFAGMTWGGYGCATFAARMRAPQCDPALPPHPVIAAQAGIQCRSLGDSMGALARHWIPAFAGMTANSCE